MNIVSISFLCFYTVILCLYWLLSNKYKNFFLLISSIVFYGIQDFNSIYVLVTSIIISWITGEIIRKSRNEKQRKYRMFSGTFLLVAILVLFKYFNFIQKEVVGISFFTFHAISYVIDVYRKDTETEDLKTVFLYNSFYPQILAGPIGKAKIQINQFKEKKIFDFENIEQGWIKILYGFFLKLVVAERLAVYVNSVYSNYKFVGKVGLAVAVVSYSLQIYCDFAGYSLIALGSAQSLGIELSENFRQPYFAKNLNDFWNRWHISLTSWFRDYLYYPLGGNRKGNIRTYINIFIVFVVSGIWHGAGVTFLIWGILHGGMQIVERSLKIKKNSRILTFLYVTFAWVFFRAESLEQAITIIKGLFINSNNFCVSDIFSHGLKGSDWLILVVTLVIICIIDLLKEKGKDIYCELKKQGLPLRWILQYILIFLIIIFGIYGPGYDASDFIYYKF